MIKRTLEWMRDLWHFRRQPSGPVYVCKLSEETRRRLLAAHIIQATAKADGSIFWGER